MSHEEYINLGLNGNAPLKVIMKGCVVESNGTRTGVVSLVYASNNRDLVEHRIRELIDNDPAGYYMVYSVPLDTDLEKLTHYPSIEITKGDLEH